MGTCGVPRFPSEDYRRGDGGDPAGWARSRAGEGLERGYGLGASRCESHAHLWVQVANYYNIDKLCA